MISPVFFVDIIFAVAMLGLGFAVGIALRRQPPSASSNESDQLKLAIGKLRDLTTTVAQDVDQHSTRVREISDELVGADMSDGTVQKLVADSVAEIIQSNERLQQQLATAEVKMQRQAEEIETQAAVARTDALTGLYNRRAFDDELRRRTAEWQRRKIVFALMMIDVDHFKKFNDQHGHPAGDEVLRRVAGVLQQTMREMDLVTRYGGEEFAIILPVTNLQESLRAAERARHAIAESSFSFEGAELKVTVSIGVAQIFDTEDEAALIKRSDTALYAAKSAGRNRVHLHDTTRCLSASEYLPATADSTPAATARKSAAPEGASKAVADAPAAASESSDLSAFCDTLDRQLRRARTASEPLSLMLIDVDDFRGLFERVGMTQSKLILDTMGDFLVTAAQDPQLVSRYGKGQFAVMLPSTELDAATAIAERIRTAVAGSAMQVKGTSMRFTISAGLSELGPNEDAGALIKRADAALFASKAAGRNCTHVHDGQSCGPARATAGAC